MLTNTEKNSKSICCDYPIAYYLQGMCICDGIGKCLNKCACWRAFSPKAKIRISLLTCYLIFLSLALLWLFLAKPKRDECNGIKSGCDPVCSYNRCVVCDSCSTTCARGCKPNCITDQTVCSTLKICESKQNCTNCLQVYTNYNCKRKVQNYDSAGLMIALITGLFLIVGCMMTMG